MFLITTSVPFMQDVCSQHILLWCVASSGFTVSTCRLIVCLFIYLPLRLWIDGRCPNWSSSRWNKDRMKSCEKTQTERQSPPPPQESLQTILPRLLSESACRAPRARGSSSCYFAACESRHNNDTASSVCSLRASAARQVLGFYN